MNGMKQSIGCFSLLITLITSTMSPVTHAADFTLRVPLNLTNMPVDVTHVVLRCLVMCIDDAFSDFGGPDVNVLRDIFLAKKTDTDVVGIGTTTRSINTGTGRLQQTLTVNVNASPGRWPDSAQSYVCAFKLRNSRGKSGLPGQNNSSFSLASGVTLASQINKLRAIGAFNNPAQNSSRCDHDPAE